MPPEKQNRGTTIGRGELEPARCRMVSRLHLGDHTSQRAIAKAIFGERQYIAVLAALCVENAIRPKPCLFEARCIEIETGQRP